MHMLVTGCNGFIGRNIVAYLTSQTDWKVNGWDWSEDPEDLPKVSHYNWVIHLGAVADITENDVEKVLKHNLDFSQWLFKECQRHGVHMQYASSGLVYGNTRDFSEYAECHPQTAYAWSKYLFDRWVFQQPHHSFVQGFRYFDVYGKWMHLKGPNSCFIYACRQQAKEKGYIEVWEGSENIKRDWVWVGDICKLHVDFINTVRGSGIWNAGTGLAHSLLDIAEEIAEQEKVEIRTVPVPRIEHLQYMQSSCADLNKLKETIGKRKWLNVYEWLDTE
jgi:ADP-L-glycero-D-manno-heptose 6-epimerase